jgi:hypothetical protein
MDIVAYVNYLAYVAVVTINIKYLRVCAAIYTMGRVHLLTVIPGSTVPESIDNFGFRDKPGMTVLLILTT